MLIPVEVAAVRREESHPAKAWVGLAVTALVLAVLPIMITILSGQGARDHLFGLSIEVQATVVSVQPDGPCGRSSQRAQVELTWPSGPDDGRGTYEACGDVPTVGESLSAWIGPTGYVEVKSPTTVRAGKIGLGVFLGGALGGLGVASMIMSKRRVRRLEAAALGQFSPPIPVEVTMRGPLRLRTVAPNPELGSDPIRVFAVLHTIPGEASFAPADHLVLGSWWLQLAAPTRSRRRVALMQRQGQRCWVELRL